MSIHYIKASKGEDGRITVESSNLRDMTRVSGGTTDEFLKAVSEKISTGSRNVGKVDVHGLGQTRIVKRSDRSEPSPRRA